MESLELMNVVDEEDLKLGGKACYLDLDEVYVLNLLILSLKRYNWLDVEEIES